MSPKFSVITPIYNVAPYLRECLRSVVAASDELKAINDKWSTEIICVDDCSTDGSSEILDELSAVYHSSLIVHHSPANAGVSAARNAGLEIATGEWLVFVDGDDVLPKDALARYEELIARDEADAYFMDAPMRFKDGEVPAETCRGDGAVILKTECGADFLKIDRRLPGFPVVRLLRRSIFGDMRFPVGVPMMEDYLTLFDNLEKKARFALVNLSAYCYRQLPKSASNSYPEGRARGIFEIYSRVYDIMIKKLGMSAEDVAWYFVQDREAIQFYFYTALRSESEANLLEVVRIARDLDVKCSGALLRPLVRLRCRILRACNRPLGFKLIAAVEYVYRGVRARL